MIREVDRSSICSDRYDDRDGRCNGIYYKYGGIRTASICCLVYKSYTIGI